MKPMTMAVLLGALACTRANGTPTATSSSSTTATEPDASCGTLGGRCSSEGATCSPAPIGSGWSHMLQCRNGTWQELEIAPLPH